MPENSSNLGDTHDYTLVMRAKDGDQHAFSTVFIRYKDDVYGCIMGILQNGEVVEDLWHDAYVKAWDAIQNLAEPARFKYWLLAIARNLAYDWLRQNRRGKNDSLEKEGSTFDPIDEKSGLGVVIERMYFQCVLAKMEPVLRDVLLLNVKGLSQAEIAHQLGYKESTVSTYLSKARKRFRQLYCEMDHTDKI
jgi:RNA polymerase sigma-70 factor (ECF subfamily)